MTGKIIRIDNLKSSRNPNESYQRICFILENGVWAKTDIVPCFRNAKRWRPVIEAGRGTEVKGLFLKADNMVDADSRPEIIRKEKQLKLINL